MICRHQLMCDNSRTRIGGARNIAPVTLRGWMRINKPQMLKIDFHNLFASHWCKNRLDTRKSLIPLHPIA